MNTTFSPAPSVDAAEAELLDALGAGDYEKRAVRLRSGYVLNTVSAGSVDAPPLVVVHGWGAGAAFYGRNLHGLSSKFRVHLVDWLGFGASSRPYFSTAQTPESAELFFITALEEWTDAMRKIEGSTVPFHLLGHSLGAFLAVGFALRRPKAISSLTLASPVGVPARSSARPQPTLSLGMRAFRWILFKLWDLGVTPQWIVRLLGPWAGRKLCRRLILARFRAEDVRTKNALVEYFYQLSVAPASGEYSLSTILRPGAWARRPLVDKLPNVECDVSFVYGNNDWMDFQAADEVIPKMRRKARLHFVQDAGHHMYYDSPDIFNTIVAQSVAQAVKAELVVA